MDRMRPLGQQRCRSRLGSGFPGITSSSLVEVDGALFIGGGLSWWSYPGVGWQFAGPAGRRYGRRGEAIIGWNGARSLGTVGRGW